MPIDRILPDRFPKPTGYSYVVKAQGSRLVFISGQVAYNQDDQLVGKGDLAAQAEQVFANLKACLDSAGATFDDVVKMTTFIVNYDTARDRPILQAARTRHLPADGPPASTLVGVQALALPDLLIEIEAIAVLP
jgi:enamine deaminase RidA (YjgF/YER057c/UK114 family)